MTTVQMRRTMRLSPGVDDEDDGTSMIRPPPRQAVSVDSSSMTGTSDSPFPSIDSQYSASIMSEEEENADGTIPNNDSIDPNRAYEKAMEEIKQVASASLEVASASFTNIKEWAKSPETNKSLPNLSASFLKCTSPDIQSDVDDTTTPYPAAALNGAAASAKSALDSAGYYTKEAMEAMNAKFKDVSLSPEQFENGRKRSNKLLRNITGPFVACGAGMVSPVNRRSRSDPIAHMSLDRSDISVMSGDFTAASWDTQAEEEQSQLQRLTSWGTTGTYGTTATYETNITVGTEEGFVPPITIGGGAPMIVADPNGAVDDDGNLIPQVLLEHHQRRREKRKVKRKRVVKFEYPPISSLRECPRADPNDLPDLFFTEEELDEIEMDRENTTTADDVEIVAALAPSEEGDSIRNSKSQSFEERDVSSKSMSLDSGESSDRGSVGFLGYQSTPTRLSRRPQQHHQQEEEEEQAPPPQPRPPSALAQTPRFTNMDDLPKAKTLPTPAPPVASVSKPAVSHKRANKKNKNGKKKDKDKILKGVQIYLRERSTGGDR